MHKSNPEYDEIPATKHVINIPDTGQKRVVVIGGGFAGLELIKKLRGNDGFQVVLIDKNNYFTFQPLLYQVATAGLEPNSVAYPFRRLFRTDPNVFFRMAAVKRIAPGTNRIFTSLGTLTFDYLVIASGSTPNYYGLPSEELLPLKSLNGAIQLKNIILNTFEMALETSSDQKKGTYLNIVVAGGGPTGVELAGAFGEMKKFVLPRDYPQIDFDRLRIYLLEGLDRLLPTMSEVASEKAKKYLEQLGVTVRLNKMVLGYEKDRVQLEDDYITTKNLIWTAGVQASHFAGLDDAVTHKGNRLVVDPYSRLVGYKNIFAIGDVAAMLTPETPEGHPMLAPVAMQQGKLLARNLLRLERGKNLQKFDYRDKGTMATIGRNRAVVDAPGFKLQGTLAWFVWMFVHLLSLVGFRNKLVTLVNWSYNYFTYDRALRLITSKRKTSTQQEKEEYTQKEAIN